MAISMKDYLNRATATNTASDKNAQTAQNAKRYIFDNSSESQKKQVDLMNPFLNRDGSLRNPNLDYDGMLANKKISPVAKKYIAEATGKTYNEQGHTGQSASGSAGKTYFSGSGNANSIVANAQKYLGTPYVWGGESMEEGGMDCSGFVYNALRDSGYDVGRTTAQGYRNYGTSVSKADMQPGDLVFFGPSDNASHIGIYVGDGKMIHSTGGSKNTKSNPGKGVVIGDVNYRSDFIEARRY